MPKNNIISKIPIYQETIQVQSSDIDEFGHVNNVCYVHWMQEIATNHSAAVGWTVQRYTELGIMWVARRHTVDYLHPAFLNDEILAETWVTEMKNVSSIRAYRFTRKSDQVVLATAETRWGFVSTKSGKLMKILPEIQYIFSENND
ncbi:MAG: acyl-CoA thioesterase [Planctomycetia bacterium]|nr:acyl-CoA thioesterase [Planctomycetia bacterium]